MKKVLLCVALALGCVACVFKESDVVIIQEGSSVADGKPLAEIVVAKNPSSVVQFAALELQEHIRLISGVKMPIVSEDARQGGYPFYVGSGTSVADKENLKKLPEQGCLIDVDDERTILVGVDSKRTNKVSVVYGPNPNVIVSARNIPSVWEKRGSLDAVYIFLDKLCGVRWLDCTEAGTFIPTSKTLVVKSTRIIDSPFIRCRDVSINPEEWDKRRSPKEFAIYQRTAWPLAFEETKNNERAANGRINLSKSFFGLRMKTGGEKIHCNHSFYWCYDRFWDKNNKNFIAYKPEWFSKHLKKGKKARSADGTIFSEYDTTRKPAQMCYSNDEFVKQTIEDVRAYFDIGGYTNRYTNQGYYCNAQNPIASWGKDVYSLEPMDNGGYCECPKCLSQYKADRRSDHAERADYWFTFVNKVAKAIKESHPDKKVSTLAYGGSREGLPSFPVEDNVVVHFCWDSNRGPNREPLMTKQMELMKKWRDAYPDRAMGLWLYCGFPHESGTWFGYLPPPGFFGKLFDKEMKYIRDLNMRECLFNCGLKDDFELYMGSRLMWNPSEDYESLKDTYFSAFGPAEQPMRNFYDIIEERICNTNYYGDSKGHMNIRIAYEKLFVDEVCDKLEKEINDAQRLVDQSGSEWHKARVRNWRVGYWDYLKTARMREFSMPSPAKGVTVTLRESLSQNLKKLAFKGKEDVLAHRAVSIDIPSKSAFLWSADKKEKPNAVYSMTSDKGFWGFVNGKVTDTVTYRCNVKIGKLKCLRIITNDPARSRFFFNLVGWRDGKKVTILEGLHFTRGFSYKGFAAWDVEFDDSVMQGEFDAIGIEDRHFEKKYYAPRFIKIMAIDGAKK